MAASTALDAGSLPPFRIETTCPKADGTNSTKQMMSAKTDTVPSSLVLGMKSEQPLTSEGYRGGAPGHYPALEWMRPPNRGGKGVRKQGFDQGHNQPAPYSALKRTELSETRGAGSEQA